jgi:hypothetical protein
MKVIWKKEKRKKKDLRCGRYSMVLKGNFLLGNKQSHTWYKLMRQATLSMCDVLMDNSSSSSSGDGWPLHLRAWVWHSLGHQEHQVLWYFSRALSMYVLSSKALLSELCCRHSDNKTPKALLKYPFPLLCFLTFIYGFLSLCGNTHQVSMLYPLWVINGD